MKSREEAWNLLTEFTQSESLRKHALAVEACMRACSRKYGDGSPDAENLWGVVGLIHDFDYERWPTPAEHPYKGNEILTERGYSDEIRRAIMSHAEYSGVTRDTPMEKCLFACDELAGFITAVALIKPGKSLAEVDAKSVRKRMKDKAFARKVNRDDIITGAKDLGIDLDEHITFCMSQLPDSGRAEVRRSRRRLLSLAEDHNSEGTNLVPEFSVQKHEIERTGWRQFRPNCLHQAADHPLPLLLRKGTRNLNADHRVTATPLGCHLKVVERSDRWKCRGFISQSIKN